MMNQTNNKKTRTTKEMTKNKMVVCLILLRLMEVSYQINPIKMSKCRILGESLKKVKI